MKGYMVVNLRVAGIAGVKVAPGKMYGGVRVVSRFSGADTLVRTAESPLAERLSLRRRLSRQLQLSRFLRQKETAVNDRGNATKSTGGGRLAATLARHAEEILPEWVARQATRGALTESLVQSQCSEFLGLFTAALPAGVISIDKKEWGPTKEFLGTLSRSRAAQGFSPSETAMFIFAAKEPMFEALRVDAGADSGQVAADLVTVTGLLDGLGLYTTEMHQKGREELIRRQERDLLELSTPVVTLWDGILALPMIGTLDSGRTQIAMEALLQRIVETGSEIAILDITGVPTVDTLTAQHLLKTVTAARLMGAECIISGIRPQIAQTIVHLGIDLGDVITKATLADAFRIALSRTGRAVVKAQGSGGTAPPAGVQTGLGVPASQQ
jgi:rsbT co-antagonist protein RsbR